MKRRYILGLLALVFALPLMAQDDEGMADDGLDSIEVVAGGQAAEQIELHVTLFGIPMDASPNEMLGVMLQHGLYMASLADTLRRIQLTGTLGGMPVEVVMDCNRERTKLNFIRFSTVSHERTNQQEDFVRMSRWLHKEYGKPDWTGSVRSHSFNRWFIDFDHDIVLIATGSGTVEAWFYENHQQRNVDYYSILKYCERYPSADVPFLTAQESVTWKNTGDSTYKVRKHVSKRKHKAVRLYKGVRGKRHGVRSGGKSARGATKGQKGKKRRI